VADSFIIIDEPATTDKRVDTEELTVSSNTVQRERCQVAGAAADDVAVVTDSDPGGSEHGLIIRVAGAPFDVTGGGLEASALRVTLASDSTGVLSVDDNGGTLTIDNTTLSNAHSEDYDTGGGTDTTSAYGIALPASGGAVAGGTSSNPLRVDPTGTTTQPVSDAGGSLTIDGSVTLLASDGTDIGDVDVASVVPGTGATNLGKAEDAAHSTGDTGVMPLAVRNDTLAALAGTDGDYAPFQVNASGALYVQEGSALDVSAATVNIQEATALDVSGATVTVTDDGSFVLAANDGVDIGDVDVASIAAGSNLVGDVGIQGRSTGGLSTFYDSDLDETDQEVKASAGTIYAIQAFNTTAAPLFLQLFDASSPTVGTTAPTNQWVVPANADSDGAGFTFNVPQGIAYSTAIRAACTTDSEGSGAPGVGDCIVNIHYS